MNKNKKNNEDIYINGKLAIAVLVTFSLLVITLVGMFVCLALDSSGSSEYVSLSDDGGSKQVSTNKQDTPVSVTSQPGKKTGIVLPCATKDGNYFMPSSEFTKDISDDTAISSAAAALIDLSNEKAIAVKNADVKIYPASMTKVMTLLVACENAKDPNALLTVTKEMVSKYNNSYNPSAEDGPSVAFTWKEGYQVTVEDALYMIIYESDTYSCWLVSEYVAGSEEAFVKLMNDKATKLGLKNTHFENSTGLYHDNHYTTCREMAAIMAAAMNNDTAKAVLGRIEQYFVDIYVSGQKNDSAGMFSNWYSGRLYTYRYEGTAARYAGNGSDIEIIGGKTGYETVPTNCYVTAGRNDITGTMYVCVQVGRINTGQPYIDAKMSTDDNRVIYQKYAKE